jgi:hypothetical protein
MQLITIHSDTWFAEATDALESLFEVSMRRGCDVGDLTSRPAQSVEEYTRSRRELFTEPARTTTSTFNHGKTPP